MGLFVRAGLGPEGRARGRWFALCGFVAAATVGCSATPRDPMRGARPGDGGTDGVVVVPTVDANFPDTGLQAGCDPSRDGDGDGLADAVEGDGDLDNDGTANRDDQDADGDGIDDRDEARTDNPCAPRDTDSDGFGDAFDLDADADGLPDAEERELGTDATAIDSDGDGVTDLGEVRGSMTDPNDATSTVPEGDFFVVLPYEGDHEKRTLRFNTNITIADVFFLVDMTGSMGGERTELINGLVSTIIPGVQRAIPDAQFGAGGFDDYPIGGYGFGNDLPFYLLRPIGPGDEDRGAWSITASPTTCPENDATKDIGTIAGEPNGRPDILEAVEGLPCHSGSDTPESYVPALWATATGMGLTWEGGEVAAQACPAIPDELDKRVGYPCFRPGALPIVLLFGDAEFHNGPMGVEPYSDIAAAPTYDPTVAALREIGARVIGIHSEDGFEGDDGGRAHYETLARDTGAVGRDGNPLVFSIMSDGTGLTDAVVDAVVELVGGTPLDVTTRLEDVAGNPDDVDATRFIDSVTAMEGFFAGVAGEGYESKNETTFYGVTPGTLVDFEIDFYNGFRMGGRTAEIFKAKILVVGDGVTDLDSRNIYIVVPPMGGTILI